MKNLSRKNFLIKVGFGIPAITINYQKKVYSQIPKKPDILLIIADDMGISDIGCYGGEINTPNLNRIAKNGHLFTRFYCEPMCVPARAVLLTGIWENKSKVGGKVPENCAIIAEVLKKGGYHTAMSGKWHLSSTKEGTPCERGFDEFFGTILGAGSFFAPLSLMRNKKNAEKEFMDKNFYYTDAISNNAIEYIKKTPKKTPLFLYVAYTTAHWPLHARPEDIVKYKNKYKMGWDKLRKQRFDRMKKLGIISKETRLSPRDPEVPAWEDEKHKSWQECRMEVYAAQIDVMDQGIGRIIETLEKEERLDNTIIIFTVDNGGCHVEYPPERKGNFLNEKTRDGKPMRPGNLPEIMPGPEDTFQSVGRGWANANNTPFRLFKLHAHQGGIRNNLLIQWNKLIHKKGIYNDTVTHMIDIMPTILEASETKHPGYLGNTEILPLNGKSFLPVLKGERIPPHEPMFWNWAKGQAIIDRKWKLVKIKKNPWELYNLDQDPTELNDLSEKHPEIVQRLEQIWSKWAGPPKKKKKKKK